MYETPLAFETATPLDFDAAVARCREELAAEGFGVLTEIDLAATLQKKLGVEIPRNMILGACHPPSAHRAVTAAPEVTVLLPRNVSIAAESRGTVVRAMNPAGAMHLLGNPALDDVARDVGSRLHRVVERLGKG